MRCLVRFCSEIEPRHEKPCLRSFRLVLTQTELYYPRRLEARIFIFRKKRECTMFCGENNKGADQLRGSRS